MPRFYYQGVDAQGRRVEGAEEARDRDALLLALQAKGIHVLKWTESQQSTRKWFTIRKDRIKASERLEFISELAHLIRSGVPVDRALQIIADSSTSEKIRKVALDLRDGLRSGQSLSEAMAQKTPEFGELTVSMIRVGEVGGVLDEVLERLAAFMARTEETKRFIISSSVYPVLLLFVGLLSIAAILGFVIPKFAVILEDIGTEIPWTTRILIQLGRGFQRWWPAVILVPMLSGLLVYAYGKRPGTRAKLHRWMLKIPLLGPLILSIELGRFARTLGTLIQSGVPLLRSLSIVQSVVRNQLLKEAVTHIFQKVQHGRPMSLLMRETPLFPPMIVHMVAIGEETGQLGEMLLLVADELDKEIQAKTKTYLSLLEPMVIVGMGVLIGGLVVSMLTAIFSINEITF